MRITKSSNKNKPYPWELSIDEKDSIKIKLYLELINFKKKDVDGFILLDAIVDHIKSSDYEDTIFITEEERALLEEFFNEILE